MRHLYTIHQTTPFVIIYRGVAESTTIVSKALSSLGIKVSQGRVSEIVSGKRWSNKAIIIRHLVDEKELLTPSLLKSLKFDGEREAKQKLKMRKK